LEIKLATVYKRKKRPQDASALIARIVAGRSGEINDNQLESLIMIDALRAMGRKGVALDVTHHAISAYHGSRGKIDQEEKQTARLFVLFMASLMRTFSNGQQRSPPDTLWPMTG